MRFAKKLKKSRIAALMVGVWLFCIASPGAETPIEWLLHLPTDQERFSLADGEASYELDLILEDFTSLGFKRKPREFHQHYARFMARVDKGTWDTVWGYGFLPHGIHRGLVTSSYSSDKEIHLNVSFEFGQDQWFDNPSCSFSVLLRRQASGDWLGEWTQQLEGHSFQGIARASTRPPRKRYGEARPATEHPRLLLNKDQLSSLREKLQTEFGQAYLAEARRLTQKELPSEREGGKSGLIHLGMLYQLTGDPSYADKARRWIEYWEENSEFEPGWDPALPVYGSGGFGWRCIAIWATYDLCYEAWDQAFRHRLERFLHDRLETRLFICFGGSGGSINWSPASNYYGPSYGSIGIATLAYLGSTMEPPEKPVHPLHKIVNVMPRKNLQADADTADALMPFSSITDPAYHWLSLSPFPFTVRNNEFPLILTRASGSLMRTGETFRLPWPKSGQTPAILHLPFVPPPQASLLDDYRIDVALHSQLDPSTSRSLDDHHISTERVVGIYPEGLTGIYYTILTCDTETTLRFEHDPDSRAWIIGSLTRPVEQQQVYRLAPGYYPILVVHSSRTAPQHSRLKLIPLDGVTSDPVLDHQHKITLARYQALTKGGTELTGADLTVFNNAEIARFRVLAHFMLGIGPGGYGAETGTYANIASRHPLAYAQLYRNVHGEELSPYAQAANWVPRKIMQSVFNKDMTKIQADQISCSPHLWSSCFASTWPSIPEAWKPIALYAWDISSQRHRRGWNGFFAQSQSDDLTTAMSFIHYPLDMQAVHPEKVAPRAAYDPLFGWYCFRSGFAGTRDSIVQMLAKSHKYNGHNNPVAGGFVLRAAGRAWVKTHTSKYGHRHREPVVMVRGEHLNDGGSGYVRHAIQWPEGGSVTIDLSQVYAPKKTRGKSLDVSGQKSPEHSIDSAITGWRNITSDFSGRCGAPTLMVVTDVIKGANGQAVWQWPLAEDLGETFTKTSRGFTLSWQGHVLTCTFIQPEEPTIAFQKKRSFTIATKTSTETIEAGPAIEASGCDRYIAVITVGTEASPPPTWSDDGTLRIGAFSMHIDAQDGTPSVHEVSARAMDLDRILP